MPVQAQVKTVDMSEEMERDAIEFAMVALSEYSVEAQMAAHIKREFDKKYRCHPHARLFCVKSAEPRLCVSQSNMALHPGQKLRLPRCACDEALYILLSGANGDLPLQIWLTSLRAKHTPAAMQADACCCAM